MVTLLSPCVDDAALSLCSSSPSDSLSDSTIVFFLLDRVSLRSCGKSAAVSASAPACAALARFTPPPPGRFVRESVVGSGRLRIVGRGLPTPFPAPGTSRGSLFLCCAESGVALPAVAPGESTTRFVPPAFCCGLVASCSIGSLISRSGNPLEPFPCRRGDVVRAGCKPLAIVEEIAFL